MKIADTVRSFKEIIEGKHDDIPEQAFYMKGAIEEVLEAAEKMKPGGSVSNGRDHATRNRDAGAAGGKRAGRVIEIPGETGYLGILPGHAPLISEVAPGEVTYRNGNQTKRLAVAWGFVEVLQDESHDSGGGGGESRRDRYRARRGGKEKS